MQSATPSFGREPSLRTSRFLYHVVLATLLITGCDSTKTPLLPTPTPTPAGDPPTANVYILPGAVNLGANAFGDEAIVIFKGERMRWQNLDSIEHTLVPDTPSFPEFDTTGALAPGDARSFVMTTTGTTRIHCAEHPQMVGTLVVREH
jgi:plastocyanin